MYEWNDKELGRVVIIPNKRAKRVIARRRSDSVQLTVPYSLNLKEVPALLQQMKPRLLQMRKPVQDHITEGEPISTFTFEVQLVRRPYSETYSEGISLSLKEGILSLCIPHGSDISNPRLQEILKKAIREVMRQEARRVLPPKLSLFATQHGLTFNRVKINSSRSRWGSCSLQKNINLSLFVMLLPEELINYILLHELAHTIEMNHSERFWQLLDRMCEGRAKIMSREVRQFHSKAQDILAVR